MSRNPIRELLTIKNVVIISDMGNKTTAPSLIAIETSVELARRGYKVIYFCAIGPVDEELAACDNITVICTGQQNIVEAKNRLKAFFSGLWNKTAYVALKAALDGLPPKDTVIHIHTWQKALSPSIFWLLSRYDFPVFITVHDYFIACPNGGFYNYRANRICRLNPMGLKCVLTNCDKRSMPQKLWRVARQLIQSAGIGKIKNVNYLMISGLSRDVLSGCIPDANIINHPNYIRQVGALEERPEILFENNNAFLYVGRLDPEKGAELFCEALSQMGIPGIAIGEGADKGTRERLAAKYPDIEFPGYLNFEAMRPYIERCRALVFPSVWYETMGLVPYEMQLHFCMPCVISRGCAAEELIVENNNGLLFNSGDAGDLIRALKAMGDDGLVRGMRRYISGMDFSRYHIDRHMERLTGIYETQN